MADFQGFWSYVHADDDAEGGRISRLASDVVAQFEMLTGDQVNLFLDKDAIGWGQNWRDKINDSLASVAFFVPVMTPRYFRSAECRRELQFFARRATELGIKELVLPLLYVDVPSIREEEPADDLIVIVQTFQWQDWRELRLTDITSESYRRAVVHLATRLVDANRHAEQTSLPSAADIGRSPLMPVVDSPGFLDRLATAEETLPRWVNTTQAIRGAIEEVGQLAQEAVAGINRGNAQGAGFAARLIVVRRFAHDLAGPAEQVWSYGNEFATQLHDVDDGFRALIERSPVEVRENPDAVQAVCEFFNTVRGLAESARQGLDAIQRMIDSTAPVEALSRDLRPPLRRLRQGLTIMIEARKVIEDWVHLIDATGIICNGLHEKTPVEIPPGAETALLSERALSDWNRPEEDAAWSHLQSGG